VLELRKPIRRGLMRGFFPNPRQWREVFVYKCKDCGKETPVLRNWNGKPPPGAVLCSCEIEKGRLEA
jgi:hypothetical protein